MNTLLLRRKSRKIGILYRIRHFVSRKVLVLLYNAFILPHITYGLEVWGAAHKTHLNPILVLQKRIVRAITFKHFRHHADPLFYELRILDVYKEYNYLIGLFMHDLLNNNLPHLIIDYVSFLSHSYNTRNKAKCNLENPKIKTSVGKQSITYAGSLIWNKIPTQLRDIISRKSFSIENFKKYYFPNIISFE